MAKAFTGTVTGRVQGVGYRYFTREQAVQLGVRGWVRNLPDGSVEFHAEGDDGPVDELLRRLKSGPTSGRVDRLAGDWLPEPQRFARFEIRP
jgi:acylphosphatase